MIEIMIVLALVAITLALVYVINGTNTSSLNFDYTDDLDLEDTCTIQVEVRDMSKYKSEVDSLGHYVEMDQDILMIHKGCTCFKIKLNRETAKELHNTLTVNLLNGVYDE